MKDRIDRIRAALDDLERNLRSDESDRVLRDFSAFELPEIIKDIVEYLMPQLTPYEVAIYLHMFCHSILQSGEPYLRIGTRSFMTGVVKPARFTKSGSESTDVKVSPETVKKSLAALQDIGAIRKEGEPNQEGTLYKVLIPEEIPVCRRAMKDRQAAEHKKVEINKEADFYNVRENRHKVFERDGYVCSYCGNQLTRFTATLDHVKPVSEGGDNSYDNLVTACRSCNSKKTGKTLGDFLADRDQSLR